MNFDFGEALKRGWQITWKHKVLWIYGALPYFLIIVFLPIFFFIIPMSMPGSEKTESLVRLIESPAFGVVFFGVALVVTTLSLTAQLFGNTAMALGALQAEPGVEKLGFRELFRSSLPYVGRVLGGTSLVFLIALIGLIAFELLSVVVGFVTMGIGSIIMHFLTYPILLAAWVVSELTQSAVVADGFGARESAERGWELFKAHLWKFVLIGLILYFAILIVGGFAILPIFIPLWFVMFSSLILDQAPDPSVVLACMLCATALLPVYAIVNGAALTFMRSTFVVTYLRLTRNTEARKAFVEANA